jgi:hypothetical protein
MESRWFFALALPAAGLFLGADVPNWTRKYTSQGTAARVHAAVPLHGTVSFRNSKGSVVWQAMLDGVTLKDFPLPPDNYVVWLETPHGGFETNLDLRPTGPTDDWELYDATGRPIWGLLTHGHRLQYKLNYLSDKPGVRTYRVFLYRKVPSVPGDEAIHYEYVSAEKPSSRFFKTGITEIAGFADLEGLPPGKYRMEIYFYDEDSVVSGGGIHFRLPWRGGISAKNRQTMKKIASVAPKYFEELSDEKAMASFLAAPGDAAEEFFENDDVVRWQYGKPDSISPTGVYRYNKYRTVFPVVDGIPEEPPRLCCGLE